MDDLTVLVADNHLLFRQRIINIINVQPDMTVVGEAGDVRETLLKAHNLRPDVILMDIDLPGCNGSEDIRLILREQPDVCIVVLTVRDQNEKLFEAIENGARGYLHKTARAKPLIDMLHATRLSRVYDTYP